MSGIKISDVRLSQSQYDSLMRDSTDLYNLRYSLPSMRDDIMRQCGAMMDRVSSRMDSRFRSMDSRIQNLGEEMANYEKSVQRELSRQQDSFRKGLSDLSKNMSDMGVKISQRFADMQKNMQDSFRLTNERINQLRADTDNKINALSSRVTALEEKEKYAATLTRQMLDYTEIQQESIENVPMHERFAPGKLNEMRNQIRSVNEDYANGAFQAALPRARDAVDQLSRLRIEVECAYNEWEQMRISALSMAREISSRIENNRQIPGVDIDGKEIPGVDLDTDYWSEGKLGRLAESLNHDIAILEKDDCTWTTQELRTWLETNADQYQATLHDICGNTRLSALLSQFRTDMGDTISEALKNQGFELSAGATEPLFEDLDPRKPLIADFESVDGAHVAFKIIPDIANFKNYFEIHSFDANAIPESQLRDRQKAINGILNTELELDVTPTRESAQANNIVPQSFSKAQKKSAMTIQGTSHVH